MRRTDEKNRISQDDDAEFVLRCCKGDIDAFGTLVERHQKKMLNMAYRMIGDYEESCDVVQEAFLSAYRAISKFRGEAKFSTWLYGIALNHARNRLQQQKTRSHHEEISINDPRDKMDESLSVLEQLEKKDRDEKIQECIRALDGEQREVLVLRDIQGCTYDEISDMLKLPDGTVKSRLFRARNALKDCLLKVLGDLK